MDAWPCRESQVRQLAGVLAPRLPCPPTVVVHGPEATGKTGVLKDYLKAVQLPHAIVACKESITGRHLLERTVAACLRAIDPDPNPDADADADADSGLDRQPYSHPRCENLSSFCNELQRALQGTEQFVLVLDGVDEQCEAPPTLLPALARLGSLLEAADNAWLWSRFCAAVWDSLAKGSARDIVSFRSVAERIWRPFVQPIVDGAFGTRDFSRLLVAQRKLFQDEGYLLDNVIEPTATTTAMSAATAGAISHDLPYYSQWLLCAAYLASYNPARQDSVFFMKASERKRRKKGGGTAKSASRPSKHRKIPRHLLSPSAFTLDRMFAILHAILPHDVVPTSDIYTQVATLGSLRLLLRSGTVGGDALEPGGRWKVNYGWEHVLKIARGLSFDILDYVAE
ncbi:hypothetical protein H2203_009019 [Taxawa tesnikishii (nom. ined.)]|nr:hypothetical protein H2203_009019 [Dothideales sp. JES 119]